MNRSASLAWLLCATVIPAGSQGQSSAEATFLGRRGTVALVELIGDYDRSPAGGASHTLARQAVGRAFYAATPDDYDFLVAFTTFEFELDEDADDGLNVLGLYTGVRNDTAGIGEALFDHGAAWGSVARLQGFVDVGPLARLELDPHRPRFDRLLDVLVHELMHRWAVRVRFRDPSGATSGELIGEADSHWSPFVDTGGGTLMHGNDWQDLGGGRFRSGLPRDAFHPFDLYLAGFLAPQEVPPIRLLRTDDELPVPVPRADLEITGEAIEITIDDVVAVEGRRDPPADRAQRRFRVGFLLLVRPGDQVTDAQIAAIERVARELETRWSILTGGRSVIDAAPPMVATDLEPGAPNPLTGGPLRPGEAIVADALAWLRAQQGPDGSWEDLAATRLRDTAAAVDVLFRLDASFTGGAGAAAWLADALMASTDDAARQILGLRASGAAPSAASLASLRALQNADGGWGLGPGYASDPLDTALALLALGSSDPAYAGGASYLAGAQGEDGSWGSVTNGPGRIPATALALRALALGGGGPVSGSGAALDWLAARQNPDGGFGDSPSTAHDTAWVLATLAAYGALDRVEAGAATAFLSSRQSVEGSWDGSVHTTALAADAIRRLGFSNLRFAAPPMFEPDPVLDGDGVRLHALVANDGGTHSAATTLDVYDGEPPLAGGEGTLVESCVVRELAPGERAPCEVTWDTTGAPGPHRLVFLLDPEDAVDELTESDNRAELDIEVGESPAGIDIELRDSEVLVDPAFPSTLPVVLTVNAVVRNNGRTDASGVVVRLLRGTAEDEEEAARGVLPVLPARSSLPVSFALELCCAGSFELAVEADPDGALVEAREDNNRATTTVTTAPNLDLEVTEADLEVIGAPLPGATVALRAKLHNRGTIDANGVQVLLALEAETGGGAPDRLVLLDGVVTIDAGASIVREVPWTVDREGDLDLVATLDPSNLAPEGDETNNEARLGFQAGALGRPNLRLVQTSVSVEPDPGLEGASLTLRARLESNGAVDADPVVVALFDGHPAQGGTELARVELGPLAPGAQSEVALSVATLAGAHDRVLFLVADPNAQLEEAVEDDNVVFANLEVLGLPDLAIGSESLRLEPPFPEPGASVSLQIEVANLGEQPSAPALVEVFRGDPLAGGIVLQSTPLAPIEPGVVGVAVASWQASSDLEAGRPLELVVVVDRAEAVAERSKANNRAVLETVTGGGGDARVSERWFSPNGDGVKDTTTFFFGTPAAGAFSLEILDDQSRVVLTTALAANEAGTSSYRWDGRDGTGRLARDGDYAFHLLDAFGNELASATVTLDTDRWPLLEAVDTPFERIVNLSCEIPTGSSRDIAWSADERSVFFDGGTGAAGGVYRVRLDGGGLERVPDADSTDLAVSTSGRHLAFRGTQGVFLVDLETGAPRREVELPFRPSRLIGFVPGQESVVVLMRERVLRVDATTGDVEVVYAGDPTDGELSSLGDATGLAAPWNDQRRGFAPDGSTLLVVRELASSERHLELLDLDTVAARELGPFRSGSGDRIDAAAFLSAERIALAMSVARTIEIADRTGVVVATIPLPPDPPPPPVVVVNGEQIPLPEDVSQEAPSVESLFSEAGGRRLLVRLRYPVGTEGCSLNGVRETYWSLDLGARSWTRIDEDAPPELFSCGSFHVETLEGGGFVERGVVHHGLRYRESAIDLRGHLPDQRGELRVRVRHQGTENAHLEALWLEIDGRSLPPATARLLAEGAGGSDVTSALAALDHEVVAVGGATVEAVWEVENEELRERLHAGVPIRLRLVGREETLSGRAARPIELPAEPERWYEVVLRADGDLVVDGEQTAADDLGVPLFRERARPDTGHPQADVLGWVLSDGERFYAALDFTVDNTRDVDGDWGALLVDTGSGWRELRVSERDTTHGRAGFGVTGAVRHRHRYYEISASLEELGLDIGDALRVRFAGYGTAALLDDDPGPTLQTMEPLGFLGDTSHVLFEDRDLGEASLALLLDDERRVPLFEDWNGARRLVPTASGRHLFFRSHDPLDDPETDCTGINEELLVLRSLANATAELRARLTSGGGVQLEGSATDLHFRSYQLEYTPIDDPDGWRLLAAPSSHPVFDGPLALWTPPSAGTYLVRLTVEDRAGNVATAVRPVATAEPPDIAALDVAPRLVSPNGDGFADELLIRYRVLRPILLRLEIHDSEGRLVRAFDRTHPIAGEDVELRWDGRDGRGLLVPDGSYTVAVLGLELFFEIDRTPPEVVASLSHDADVPLRGSLAVQIDDLHLDAGPLGVVETGDGAAPVSWMLVEELERVEPDVPGSDGERFRIDLDRAGLLDHSFRVDVRDAAGNRTVVTVPPIELLLFPIASGPDLIDPISGSFLLEGVSAAGLHGLERKHVDPEQNACFENPDWPQVCGVTTLPTNAALRLRVQTTFPAPPLQLFLQFRPFDAALLNSPEEDLLWNERPFTAIYEPGGVVTVPTYPENGFDVVSDLAGVDRTRLTVVRLRALDAQGFEHFSDAFRLAPRADVGLVGRLDLFELPHFASLSERDRVARLDFARALAASNGYHEPSRLLWGAEVIDGVVTAAELSLQSDDDGRYDEPARFAAVAIADGVFLFEAPTIECATYRTELVVTDASGMVRSVRSVLKIPCLHIELRLDPMPEPECGAIPGAESMLGFSATPRSLDGADLKQLRVEVIGNGRSELLDTRNAPVSGGAERFDLALSTFEEGRYLLLVELVNERDDVRGATAEIYVDRTPPMLELTSPAEAASVCGELRIEGRAQDTVSGLRIDLETQEGSACSTNSIYGGSASVGAGWAVGLVAGELARISACEGEVAARVIAYDRAGNTTCVERSATLDAAVLGTSLQVSGLSMRSSRGGTFSAFSPNGDGELDVLDIALSSGELTFVDLEVLQQGVAPECSGALASGGVVRSLARSLPVSVDGSQLFWDGVGDGSLAVSDGLYAVAAHFEDACRNRRTMTYCSVVVDTAPPQLRIEHPAAGSDVGGLVAVEGSAIEAAPSLPDVLDRLLSFDSFELDYRLDAVPDGWSFIHAESEESESLSEHLATWSVHGLAGPVTLRLGARDVLGNHSELLVPLRAVDVPRLVGELEPVPRLFSPNGDDRRELTAVRFALEQPAVIDLEVRGADATMVRTLAAGESLPAGAIVRTWDGLQSSGVRAPDGVYSFVLVARLASQPAVQQTVRTVVVLDATPPMLALESPVGGFVASEADVTIRVEDSNPGAWRVELAPGGGGVPAWQTIASGTGAVAGAVVGRLGDLEEGLHRLRVSAADRAESETELEVAFTVDRSPPVVTLVAPAEGAAVSTTVTLVAHIEEAHRAGYRIEIAPGLDPADGQFEVVAQSADAAADISHELSLQGRAEGPWTLRLVALDLAGNEREVGRRIRIDRSPPTVDLVEPPEDSFVREPLQVRGEVADANLASWTLSLGTESDEGAALELASGDAAVPAGGALALWTALPPDGRYELRLSARDHAGNEGTAHVGVTVDRTPPAPPADFRGTVEPGGGALLEWRANIEPDLAGYRLAREGGAPQELASGTTSAHDAGLFEGSYRYTLVAFDRAGNESAPAGPVTLAIDTTPPDAALLRPRAGERVGGVIEIVGTAASASDFREYRILVAVAPPPAQPQLLRRSPLSIRNGPLAAWDTSAIPDGTEATLELEAEDTTGNVARVSVSVVVDHGPPATPQGLIATVTGDDVALAWQPNEEADLLGYVLLRDGAPLDTRGAGVADLRELAVREASHLDVDLGDGTYNYQVLAVDIAGNASPPSATAPATIETGPPAVRIVVPEESERVEGVVPVLAESPDEDVAQVRFEVRAADVLDWTLLAIDDAAPWSAEWDGSAAPFGFYDLRAVASEAGGLEGLEDVVRVELTELTPPLSASGLEASANGAEVSLSWTAVEVDDLAGYHVERSADAETWLRLTAQPLDTLAYVDSNLVDGEYRYRVLAVDVNGNESEPSPEAGARVFTPVFEQPWTPIGELFVGPIQGRGPEAMAYRVEAEVERPDGSVVPQPAFEGAADGSFALPILDLERGRSVVAVRLIDPEGDRSKPASVVVVSAAPPSTPTGFAATVTGFSVSLGWNANPEPAIAGYALEREGEAVVADSAVAAAGSTASSSRSSTRLPARAIDGNANTWWAPAGGGVFTPPEWIEVQLDRVRVLAGIELDWRSQFGNVFAPLAARVEGWSGEAWVPLRAVPSGEATAAISFPRPYATARVRVLLFEASTVFEPIRLVEVRPIALGLVEGLSFEHEVTDGVHDYELVAFDSNGLASAPAVLQVPVGDTTAPEAVTLTATARGSEVDLAWTASAATDTAGYALYRNGSRVESRPDPAWLAHTDGPLRNGVYRYRVTAFDTVGNESESSNEVAVSIDVAPPEPPLLQLVAVDRGTASLAWTPAESGSPAVAFSLRRGSTSGGPHAEISRGVDLSFVDDDLDPEATYFYLVHAIDVAGNESGPSNEVEAVPVDGTAPLAPRLFFPTLPGQPIAVETIAVDVAGFAEPGAAVELFRGGSFGGVATAVEQWSEQRVEIAAASADFSNDGAAAVVVDDDRALWLVTFPAGTVEPLAAEVSDAGWLDERSVLFADSAGVVRRLDVVTRETSAVADADVVAELSVGADALVVAVAERDGQAGLWQLDLETGTWRLLLAGDSLDAMNGLAIAPDGSRVALSRELDGLLLVEIENGTARTIDAAGFGRAAWSPRSDALLYVRSATEDQLWLYDTASEATAQVTNAPFGATSPLWSPDGSSFAYSSDGVLYVEEWGSVGEAGAVGPWLEQSEWTPAGPIGGLAGEVVRLVPAGLVRFDAVGLFPGTNVLAARARDGAGHESAFSETIAITLAPSALPDLELRSTELVAVPAAVEPLAPLRVSAVVRNVGAHETAASELELVLTDSSGAVAWSTVEPLPALEPEGYVTVLSDLALENFGAYQLRGRADPRARVTEGDETNNQAMRVVRVLERGAPGLDLDVPQSSYEPGEVVRGTLVVTGRGAFRGRLRVRFEDERGFEVATLVDQTLSLGFGEVRSWELAYDSTGLFAGLYRLRARLDEEGGSQVGEAVATVAVGEHILATGAVDVDRAVVVRPGTVELEGVLRYVSGNALLDDVALELLLLDPSGVEVERWAETTAALLPGDVAPIAFAWSSGGAATGRFRVLFTATADGSVLAQSEGLFDVAPAPPVLLGELSAPARVATGSTIEVSFRVDNLGEIPATSQPVRVVLRSPSAGVQASEAVQLDVPAGGEASGATSFATAGLRPGAYLIVLEAELSDEGSIVLLDTAAVELVDGEAPELELRRPADGGFLGAGARALVRAFDRLSGIAAVELVIDEVLNLPAIPLELDSQEYGARLDGAASLAEGAHSLRARAVDRAGNETTVGPAPFVFDATPPSISVLGVAEGQVSPAPLQPVVEIVDEHPAVESVLLDGRPFASGSVVGIGLHRLDVVAVDLAGNRAALTLSFEIASSQSSTVAGSITTTTPSDLGSPLLASVDLRNESVQALAALPVALVLRDAATSTEVARQEWTIGLAIAATETRDASFATDALAAGEYELVLTADLGQLGGGTTQLDLEIVTLEDATPPQLELLEPPNGAVVPEPFAVRARSFDVHSSVAAVELAVDGGGWTPLTPTGQPDEYGVDVAGIADGERTLAIRAVDTAANTVQISATVAVDGSPPEIAVSGVLDGQAQTGAVTPVVAVVDAHLDTVTLRLDGDSFVSGTEVSDIGSHVLEIDAADLAGNTAELDLAFEIHPSTGKELRITSPIDGARVDARTIRVEGEAEPATRVRLVLPEARNTVADQSGLFEFEDVALRYGENGIVVALEGEPVSDGVTVERLRPDLSAELRVVVEIDEGQDGPGPADALRYELALLNLGEGSAHEVAVRLPLPAHTSWVEGPRVEGVAGPEGELDAVIATLAPSDARLVEWRVEIDPALPAGIREIVAQAEIAGAELPQIRSDDPSRPGAEDATVLGLAFAAAIPTAGGFALVALALALAMLALRRSRGTS